MLPDTITDPAFLERLRQRDPEALADTVRQHARPMVRAAVGMGLRIDQAEDLVQDCFATFFTTLDRFEGRSQVKTWLFGILHRKMFEAYRKKAADARFDPIDDVFESRFDAQGK